MARDIDTKTLLAKVIYIYFCFFAMAAAERYGMSIAYGAATFISLSVLSRSVGFIKRNKQGMQPAKALVFALALFFLCCTVYIFVLYPFLYTNVQSIAALAIIILPFIERGAENALLRRKSGPLSRRAIAATILPLEAGLVALTGLIVWISGRAAFEFIIASALGMGLFLLRQTVYFDFAENDAGQIQQSTRQIRSVRLYDGMVITSGVALNMFAFAYVLYIVFSRRIVFFHSFFIVFIIVALIFGVMVVGIRRFLRATLIRQIGKNAVFALGTAIAIFAAYGLRGSWLLGGVAISMQAVLLLIGLTLQMAGAIGLSEDIVYVIKLGSKDFDKSMIDFRSRHLNQWTALISETVILIVLGIFISSPFFVEAGIDDYIELAPHIGGSIVIIPIVFLLLALVYAIKQPLTKKYTHRLKRYVRIKEAGQDNPEMEKRLKNVLYKRYKKRIGVYIIRAFLKPVMFHTIEGQNHVDALPGIFVFNHREVYGPVAAVVFLPYDMRPWVLSVMLDKKQIKQHMYEGTFSRKKWLPVFIRRLLPYILSPFVVWALSSLEPIPVFRGTARNVIKTFELSVACLMAGDSLLIFPENPQERYTQTEQISAFYRGFAHIGRLYHKRTQESITFYPVYASRHARMLRIGEGIVYDPANGRKEEHRIVDMLESRMRALRQLDES